MTRPLQIPSRRPYLAEGTKHIGLHGIVTLQDDRTVTVRGAAEFCKVMVVDEIKAKSRKLRTQWSVSEKPALLVGSWTGMLDAEVVV